MLRLIGKLVLWGLATLSLFTLIGVFALNWKLTPDQEWVGQDIETLEERLGPAFPVALDAHAWVKGFPSLEFPLVVKGVSVLTNAKQSENGWRHTISEVQPYWMFFFTVSLNMSYEVGASRGLFCFWTDAIKRCDNWL